MIVNSIELGGKIIFEASLVSNQTKNIKSNIIFSKLQQLIMSNDKKHSINLYKLDMGSRVI